MSERVFKCHATFDGKTRCTFEGDNEAAGAHWRETGHPRCPICGQFLATDERMVCQRCITRARSDLGDITECVALIPEAVTDAAWRGALPVDLMAFEADGSLYPTVQRAHPEDYRGVERPNDPWSVLAVLEQMERDWRHEFGHGPAVDLATTTGCAGYLSEWLWLAARTHPGFDADAETLRILASRLRHAVGTANDPAEGVGCLDCPDVHLVQTYRPPVMAVPDPRRSADGYRGQDVEGREDYWHCPRCRRSYDAVAYGLAVRQHAAKAKGWVPVRLAAEVLRRPVRTVWQWVQFGEVSAACRRVDRKVMVDMDEVRELDALKDRRKRTAVCA